MRFHCYVDAGWLYDLKGKEVVFTGAFDGYDERDLSRLAIRLGARRVSDDGNLSTNVLVRGQSPRWKFSADATDDTSRAIEWTMPDGRYVDAAPILILTTASLRTAADYYPNGTWDVRRFRPNVLIDLEGDGWIEDSWVGRQIQLGAVTLIPTQPCIRCTMVTRKQPGLAADIEMFRTLARHHGGLFGVWSDVVIPRSLSLGDRAANSQQRVTGVVVNASMLWPV